MVGSIDIRRLTLDELTGVVNLYPWFGSARVELCRRTGENWGGGELAAHALYVADRTIIGQIINCREENDYTDSSARIKSEKAPAEHRVRVAPGDYFSQEQYDKVKDSEDNVFTRLSFEKPGKREDKDSAPTDIAELYPTETLAAIFAEQGLPGEAKRIYSKLVLDIPEKSAYFASLIDKLK